MAYMGKFPSKEPTRIVAEPEFDREGYAVIKCGNTEVQVGLTLLHNMRIHIDADSPYFVQLAQLQAALWIITAEALEGHTGESQEA